MHRLPLRAAALTIAVVAVLFALSLSSASAATATIAVGDVWYCDSSYQFQVCETAISAGDTVVWDFSGANLPHTVTECGASCDTPSGSPLWDSGIVSDGSFSFTITEPGTYRYYCEVHPAQQRGRIIVTAVEEEPTATSPAPSNGEATATPGAGTATTAPSGVPPTGFGPDNDTSTNAWAIVLGLAAAGVSLAAAGAAIARRAATTRDR